MRNLVARLERLEQQLTGNHLTVTIRRFSGGALIGYSSGGGCTGIVRRLSGEDDETLHDRAAKLITRAHWGGIVMAEVRE